jgi:hypothetical protein
MGRRNWKEGTEFRRRRGDRFKRKNRVKLVKEELGGTK